MTERIRQLKQRQSSTRPSLSAERARLVTEAYELYAGEPLILLKAHTLAYLLKHMTIFIQEGELIVGNHTDKPRSAPVYPEFNSQWIAEQIDDFPTRGSDPLTVSPEDRETLLSVLGKWKGRSLDEVVAQALPRQIKFAEASGVMTVGNRDCATGHIIPDYHTLLQCGLSDCIARCREYIEHTAIANEETQKQVEFWQAAVIAMESAQAFANRFARLAAEMAETETSPRRREELLNISHICGRVPTKPPETFHEAVQFVWFLHLIVTIESNGHGNSFARFDQYTNEFYVRDMERGMISREEAIELLECFFLKATDIIKVRDSFYSESFAGYPVWQNLIVGGQTKDGKDATNELSYLVLEANADVQTSQPTVSVRYFDGLSPKMMRQGLTMIQQGLSTPAFFNDKLVIPMVMEKFGATLEEARQWGILGCVEPCIPGCTDGRPTVGYVNLLKCLELALNNGVDPLTGEKLGPETGAFESLTSLEELQSALFRQIDFFVDLMLTGFNLVGGMHATRQPMPFASILIQGCMERGTSIQCGGAKYSESGAFICGIGNTADALAAIDTLVYQKKTLTAGQLLDCLRKNFEGEEQLRLTLLNKAPKYGNDDDFVDGIAAAIVGHYRESLAQYHDSRGGGFTAVVESQSLNVSQGKCVGASADGRFAYEPVNDNCSPVMGRDVSGPTAAIRSVSKLNQWNAQDGCLYNIRFDPRSISGEKGLLILDSIVKTYFERMGEHIQINVVDDETLRQAQQKPEQYRDLLVRVAGYLAYFTELDRDVQNNIILRTSHSA
ncbi:MAG: formate C-acetyltransferase/glycerol dehydratase family glycyl radical enzyme [Oscillospiraceae bacterium]|nr:formate C-acetyltransferase/glycerol dehydratase family glycyl radical enzyme [Oscillospiraceae bacterium]